MSKSFEHPPTPGTNRFRVSQLPQAADPKFAVFARTPSGQSARFSVLHDTIDSAIEVAREHAAERVASGCTDFTFYIVELKHRIGIERGKLVDEPMK